MEFELETKEAAEQFRETLDAKIPPELKRENWHYSNKNYKIDFYHITFQDNGKMAGTYSYELTPDGKVYLCTLDLKVPAEINIPNKIMSNTMEFNAEEIRYLQKNSKDFEKRGFMIYTTSRFYPTFKFAHQAITKNGQFVARYDQERNGSLYACRLNINTKEISDLLQEWVHEIKTSSLQEK